MKEKQFIKWEIHVLSAKSIRSYGRLERAMGGYSWALGAPFSYVARGTIIRSPAQVAIPYCSHEGKREIEGYTVRRFRENAFKGRNYLQDGGVSLPILSPEDTFVLALKNNDSLTAYHLMKNNGMDKLKVKHAIKDEAVQDSKILRGACEVLAHFEQYMDVVDWISSAAPDEYRHAVSLSREEVERMSWEAYESLGVSEQVKWEHINSAIEDAEDNLHHLLEERQVAQRKMHISS